MARIIIGLLTVIWVIVAKPHLVAMQSMADGPFWYLKKYSITFLPDALLILILYESAQKNWQCFHLPWAEIQD